MTSFILLLNDAEALAESQGKTIYSASTPRLNSEVCVSSMHRSTPADRFERSRMRSTAHGSSAY
jgi:hypothetical protein